jgi:hypothetical protein
VTESLCRGFELVIGFIAHLKLGITNNYTTQNYWVWGLFPSSGILEIRKHDVSETYPVSETSYFIFSRILDDGKYPKTL